MTDPETAGIRVGTSGWSYPHGRGTWNGLFYPRADAGRGRRFDELEYYAGRFDTVEVNSTFYRIPTPQVSAGWARRTPAGFEFSIKLFQKFTHPAMFAERNAGADIAVGQDDVDDFRVMLEPLVRAGKLGPLLAQFPPSFHAEAEALDYLRWLLTRFREYPVAVELRHRSWSDASHDLTGLLREFGATWVLIDEPKFRLSIEQRCELRESVFGYVRMHGRNAEQWWQHDASEDRYNYFYSSAELEPIAEAATAARRLAKKLYVYMNNHFESKAAANAVMLKSRLGLAVEGTYPAAFVERFPELRGTVTTAPEESPRLI